MAESWADYAGFYIATDDDGLFCVCRHSMVVEGGFDSREDAERARQAHGERERQDVYHPFHPLKGRDQ